MDDNTTDLAAVAAAQAAESAAKAALAAAGASTDTDSTKVETKTEQNGQNGAGQAGEGSKVAEGAQAGADVVTGLDSSDKAFSDQDGTVDPAHSHDVIDAGHSQQLNDEPGEHSIGLSGFASFAHWLMGRPGSRPQVAPSQAGNAMDTMHGKVNDTTPKRRPAH